MSHTTELASKHRLEFNTDDVALHERTDYWHDKIEAFFQIEKPEIENEVFGFQGSMQLLQCSRSIFGKVNAQHQLFYRDSRKLITDGLDHFIVQVFLEGGGAVEDGDVVKPGDFLIIDMGRQHARDSSRFTHLSFVIPRDNDPFLSRILEPLHNKTLPGNHPLLELIRRQMKNLWDIQDDLSLAQMELAMDSSIDLIKATLNNLFPLGSNNSIQASPALAQAIKDHIESNLDKPLSAEQLSKRFNVSRAHLYRMFAREEGISRYIRERRLMKAYRLLIRNGTEQTSSSIAAACGFKSESHFSNTFKARFGRNPIDVRFEGNTLNLRTDGNRELLNKWLAEL